MYLHGLMDLGIATDRVYTLGLESEDTLHRDWYR